MGLSENEVYHPQVAILIGRVLIDHQWIQGYPTCSNTHEFTNNHNINVWCLVLCLCECRTWWIHDEYMMNHDYTKLNSGNMQTNPCWQESWVLWRMFLTALGPWGMCYALEGELELLIWRWQASWWWFDATLPIRIWLGDTSCTGWNWWNFICSGYDQYV